MAEQTTSEQNRIITKEQPKILQDISSANSQLIELQLRHAEDTVAKKYAVQNGRKQDAWDIDKSSQELNSKLILKEQQLATSKMHALEGGIEDDQIEGAIEDSKIPFKEQVSAKIYAAHHDLQREYLDLLRNAANNYDDIDSVTFPTDGDYNELEEIGIAQAQALGMTEAEIQAAKDKALAEWKAELVLKAQQYQGQIKDLKERRRLTPIDQWQPIKDQEEAIRRERTALYTVVSKLDVLSEAGQYFQDYQPPMRPLSDIKTSPVSQNNS